MIARFFTDRSGASSIEYAMIAACISIVIVAACTTVGQKINAKFYGPLLSGFR